MIIVTGSVTAKPETFAELRQASLDHVHRSRTEDGCLLHSVHIDVENPLRLFFYKHWRDMASLKAHGKAAGSLAFLAQIGALAASSEAIQIHETLSA